MTSEPPQSPRVFTLSLSNKVTVELCTLGASITKLILPSLKTNQENDCVLGYDTAQILQDTKNPSYFAVIVGRVANRIAQCKFHLNGEVYDKLYANDGSNCLHGGLVGFSRKVWNAKEIPHGVEFSLTSPDGDEGFPSTVHVTASYTLQPSDGGAVLKICMKAELDASSKKASPINLAQHSYFNLSAHDTPHGILNHTLTLPDTVAYTPIDAAYIPNREMRSLDQDPSMDFRSGKLMKDALLSYAVTHGGLSTDQAKEHLKRSVPNSKDGNGNPYGFDHNFCLKQTGGLVTAAILEDASTGRKMTVKTDAPGLQLYSGNFLDASIKGKNDAKYKQWQSVCLETQHFPDSIGVTDGEFAKGACFVLEPGGEGYEHNVEYHFEFSE